MKILIRNLSNTYNYGSMMMGENFISYLTNKLSNCDLQFYIDAKEEHIKRLKEATLYDKIYIDSYSSSRLITEKIKYVRAIEAAIKRKISQKKIASFYDAIIILGGDDYAETYYSLPKDNLLIKSILNELKNLSEKTKVYMIGQTIGPYTGIRIEWAKEAFRTIKIYSRDDVSADYVKKTLGKEVIKSRDLAFLDLTLQAKYQKQKAAILKSYDVEENKYITIVGTGLISHYTPCEDDMSDKFFSTIIQIKQKFPDFKIVWLSHVVTPNEKNDNDLLDKINKKHDNYLQEECVVINKPILPALARFILGNGKMTITCRMHAAVSTSEMGKPAICLSYSSKYKGVIA
ncbi:MAG: polysaccharide pyruvyl transferase family protein, partial [Bacilli bacterium]|nr:polysaccharide pyruvyl transferase family protein [Bacilli bacterium]